MGVLAPRSAHARPSARPPIDTSGNFWHTCLQSHLQTSPPSSSTCRFSSEFAYGSLREELSLFQPHIIRFWVSAQPKIVDPQKCWPQFVEKIPNFDPPQMLTPKKCWSPQNCDPLQILTPQHCWPPKMLTPNFFLTPQKCWPTNFLFPPTFLTHKNVDPNFFYFFRGEGQNFGTLR
jgi:hypothetical protein